MTIRPEHEPRINEYEPIPEVGYRVNHTWRFFRAIISLGLFLLVAISLGTLFYFIVERNQIDDNCVYTEFYFTICCDEGFDYSRGFPRCIESVTSTSEDSPDYVLMDISNEPREEFR